MVQALLFAYKQGTPLTELVTIHLVCYAILMALGPCPQLQSVLEIYRSAMATVSYATGVTPDLLTIPETYDQLKVPEHPNKDGQLRPMTTLKDHVWAPWLVAHLSEAIQTMDSLMLAATEYFCQPRFSTQELILRFLHDTQLVFFNIKTMLELLQVRATPEVPPEEVARAPSTPPRWGE